MRSCLPHHFLRVNTVFEVVKAAGGYTAWSDKHRAYDFVLGPSGTGVDDLFSPEIASDPVPLTTAPYDVADCHTLPDPSPSGDWTSSFADIKCYDTDQGASHSERNRRQDPRRKLFGSRASVVWHEFPSRQCRGEVGTKRIAEHGGFSHDDTNVIMLVSNPELHRSVYTGYVETRQVPLTILRALGLNPAKLQAVQIEGGSPLPGLPF
jgi:hypothetical protein